MRLIPAILFTAIALALGAAVAPAATAQEPAGVTLTIEQNTDPRDRDTRFEYTAESTFGGSDVDDFDLVDDDRRDRIETFSNLAPGRYRIEQEIPRGWTLEIDCDGDKEVEVFVGSDYVRLEVPDLAELDEDVRCEFTNQRDEPTPTATPSPAPTSTPAPVIATPVSQVPCVVNGAVVFVVGLKCPEAPTPTPVPAQQVSLVQTIKPPSTGDGGLR